MRRLSANGTELKADVLNRSSIAARRPGDAVRLRLDRSQVREVS